MMCTCKSLCLYTEGDEEVILYPPDNLGIIKITGEPKEAVSVDACIAPVIEHLWKNGIVTLNSCCGHNINPPSIIFEDNLSQDRCLKIKNLIAEVDQRKFQILSWIGRNLLDVETMQRGDW